MFYLSFILRDLVSASYLHFLWIEQLTKEMSPTSLPLPPKSPTNRIPFLHG